jgi:hypothetical protein
MKEVFHFISVDIRLLAQVLANRADQACNSGCKWGLDAR